MPFFDRIKAAIAKLVLTILPSQAFVLQYSCVVNAQNADGTLDLTPDDQDMPGVQGVPIRLGLPGVSVTVQSGSRVLMAFASPGPSSPYASLWDGQSVVTGMNIANGSNGAARVGDPVTIALSDLAQFVFTAPPGGGPCVVTGAIVGIPATQISGGSSILKVGG